jgi:hypothetical protein
MVTIPAIIMLMLCQRRPHHMHQAPALDNSKTGSVHVLLDVSAKYESSGVPHNASDVIANSQADNVSVMNSNVHGFVDVIDMSVHNFLG